MDKFYTEASKRAADDIKRAREAKDATDNLLAEIDELLQSTTDDPDDPTITSEN